jgi:hypothetical protein
MQTIEQIPPETKKPEVFTDEELASLALAETPTEAKPVTKRTSSVGRAVFWAVMVLGAIVVGLAILAMVALPVIGC